MTLKNKNIIIVGMTGAGKTTIGKILSKEISRNFFDIDQEIEKISNLKIRDFFRIYGDAEFGKSEKSLGDESKTHSYFWLDEIPIEDLHPRLKDISSKIK